MFLPDYSKESTRSSREENDKKQKVNEMGYSAVKVFAENLLCQGT